MLVMRIVYSTQIPLHGIVLVLAVLGIYMTIPLGLGHTGGGMNKNVVVNSLN